MAAPTSTNEVTARKLSSSISALWTKIKSTFQPVADRVTSIRAASSATDTNYPTEKAVRTELDKKVPIYNEGSEVPSSQDLVCLRIKCPYVSGVYKSQVLLYDITSFADGTIVNNDGAFVTFKGFLIGGKPTGSGDAICVKICAKVAYTQISGSASFRTLKSDSSICGPEIIKRTEDGVDKYYLSIFYESTLFQGNDVLVGSFRWRAPNGVSDYSYKNGVIGEYRPNQTYPDNEPLWDRLISFTSNVAANTSASADKLSSSRKLKTNLARTADSTFDGSSDQTNIPVTGTLPVANGGTGKTSVTSGNYVVGDGTSAMVEKTPKEVGSNVLSSLDDKSNASSYANFVDGDFVVGSDHVDASTISASTFVRRTALNLWNYIKSKLSGPNVNIGGNAATAWTADTAKAFDGSFTGTNSIASALNGKSPTTHTHKTDAADVTSDNTNLGDAEDTMQFVTTDAAGYDSSHKPLYRRPALKIWNWIKSKLASDTGYINFAHSVASATNVNSHVLAGVVFADNSLHSCMFTFVMAVTFNFRESDECGGILKVDVGIGTGGFYVKNISLSNVTGALSVGDFNLVVGEVLNRKVVGVTWNGVLKGTRYLRGTILSRYVAGDDTEFMYNGDVANGATQAWSSARQWADDSAVVHIAGSETITGAKEFSRSGQDTNFTDSSGAESIVRARTATNSNNGSCQLDAYASGGKYGLYARNSGGAGKWVANLDNDGVVNLGSSGDAVRIGGTKFVFGASRLGTDSNTFYWV